MKPVENSLVYKEDEPKQIKQIKSKYLESYLISDAKTYLLANDVNFSSMFKAFSQDDVTTADLGTGMIAMEQSFWNLLLPFQKNPYDGIKIDRQQKTITFKEGILSGTERIFDIDGWSGRYGKPLELSLTMHLGTMAPEFAYKFATAKELDTKVYLEIFETGILDYLVMEVDGKKYKPSELRSGEAYQYIKDNMSGLDDLSEEEKGKAIRSEIDDIIEENMELTIASVNNVQATPYITRVERHWFRNLMFEDKENRFPSVYNKKEVIEEDTEYVSNSSIPNIKKYTKRSEIEQISEPHFMDATEFVSNMLENEEYYIYNGAGHSAKKKKINIFENFTSAIAMLEATPTIDAEYILRDLKALLMKHGMEFTEEDFGEFYEIYVNDRTNITWTVGDFVGPDSITIGEDGTVTVSVQGPGKTGVREGTEIKTNYSGTVISATDNILIVKFDEFAPGTYANGTVKYTNINTTLKEGEKVTKGMVIGKTKNVDLLIEYFDQNGEKIINVSQEMDKDTDFKLLCDIVAAEAGGESDDGQIAVAAVIYNRVNDTKYNFPSTVRGVIFEGNAFSPVSNGSIHTAYNSLSEANKTRIQNNVKNATAGKDPSGGALFFNSDNTIPSSSYPTALTVSIGGHKFYKIVE